MERVYKRDISHKYFALIFLVFCFLLLLSTNCFATTVYDTDNNVEIQFGDFQHLVPDGSSYFAECFYNNNISEYIFKITYFSPCDIIVAPTNSSNVLYCKPGNYNGDYVELTENNIYYTMYTRSSVNGVVNFDFNKSPLASNTAASSVAYNINNYYNDGTVDIYRCPTNSLGNSQPISNIDFDNPVFHAPPQQVEEVETTILAPIVATQETEKTLQEIIQILPVILIVLVGLIAIRKAIQFLIARMKQS